MSKSNTVTCSFTMDREIYNAYKSIVCKKGENVKGNLVRYMMSVIRYETPNADTIAAIEEVQKLKADPDKKSYESFGSQLLDQGYAYRRLLFKEYSVILHILLLYKIIHCYEFLTFYLSKNKAWKHDFRGKIIKITLKADKSNTKV